MDTQTQIEPRLIHIDKAAKILGCSRTTLCKLMAKGEFPYVKFGAGRRIRPSDIDAYIAKNTVNANA
jgi:excisionase family DNA binding protein